MAPSAASAEAVAYTSEFGRHRSESLAEAQRTRAAGHDAEAEPEADADEALSWDVWCIAQGVAAACAGAMDGAPPDVTCLGAAHPDAARRAQPARLPLRRGCAPLATCAAGARACARPERAGGAGGEAAAEEPPPRARPEPPPGWEYCGPADDDLQPCGGFSSAPVPGADEVAAAAASVVAAERSRQRVRATLASAAPISDANFFPVSPHDAAEGFQQLGVAGVASYGAWADDAAVAARARAPAGGAKGEAAPAAPRARSRGKARAPGAQPTP